MWKKGTDTKKRNIYRASLAIVIVMTCVSLIEMIIYLLFDQYDDTSFIILFGSSFSFAISIFLLIWFICLAAKHKNIHGVTIVFVSILALSWLISAVPLFISIMSTYAGGYTLRSYTYTIAVFNIDAYFGSTLTDIWLPYSNLIVCGVLLLVVPCLFSNAQIKLKEEAHPVTEAVVSTNGELKKVDHTKNRFRFSLTISIITFLLTVWGFIFIMNRRFFGDIMLEIIAIGLLALTLIVMIPLHKRINTSAFVFICIFIVILIMSSIAISVLSQNSFYNGERYDSQITFYGLFIKGTYSGYLSDGTWNADEHTVPYIDLVITALSVVITSILFAQDRKRILRLKKDSPVIVE